MKIPRNERMRTTLRVRKVPLASKGREDDLEGTTPGQRIAMVEELTREAWAFKGEPIGESRLQRHLVRLFRRGG